MINQSWARRLLAKVRRLKQQYDLEQGEATVVSLQRFRLMALVAVPLHLLLAAWFATYPAPSGRPELVRWAQDLSSVHATTGAIVLVLALFVHWLLQPRGRATAAGVALHLVLCATYLLFGVITSAIDIQAAAPGGLSSYIMVCIVVAMISIMRPVIALPLFLFGAVACGTMLGQSRVGDDLLPSLVINAMAVTVLSMVTSVITWHQYVKNNMLRRDLISANQVLQAKQRELELMSDRDGTTGLYNRRAMLQLLGTELARTLRNPQEISVVLVGLDHFPSGHAHSDNLAAGEWLCGLAAMLTQAVRSTDRVARMGAVEFMLLLPSTDRDNAVTVAEKLREHLRRLPALRTGLTAPVKASFGVSGLAFNELATVDALYAAAERALHRARESGGDRVVYAAPDTSPQLISFEAVRG